MIEISGIVQDYPWGSTEAIPTLLGTEPTRHPQAEYWLGAHPKAPSPLLSAPDGHDIAEAPDLQAWLDLHPEDLGAKSRQSFGDRLPYLLKLLSADQPLSLQAHPSRREAETGFAAENAAGVPIDSPTRTYRDDWPKPEMLVALTSVDALCGFRDPARTAALFEGLDLPVEFSKVIGPLTFRGGEAGLAEVFLDALSTGDGVPNWSTEVVAAAVRHQYDDGPLGTFARTAIDLDEHRPNDPGIIAALLLNRVRLRPGEAIYLPAGNMHAYLRGTGVEVMANSDNVLRGGLTDKHIDVDALVQVVDFAPVETTLVETRQESPGVLRYLTPAPEFALWRLGLDGSTSTMAPATDLARTMIVLQGHLVASSATGTLELVQGRSVFLPAGEAVQLDGNGVAFLAAAGV